MENKEIILKELDQLSTENARRFLGKVITDAGLSTNLATNESQFSPEVLAEAFGHASTNDAADLEKQALLVFAMDPVMEDFLNPRQVKQAKEKPLNFSFDPTSLLTTVTLAMVVLSTYVHIKRDAEGKWTFEFRIKNSSENLKKELIKLAQRLAVGGSSTDK